MAHAEPPRMHQFYRLSDREVILCETEWLFVLTVTKIRWGHQAYYCIAFDGGQAVPYAYPAALWDEATIEEMDVQHGHR